MKILGWILILVGSNGLTGTLVARNSIRYDPGILVDSVVERVVEVIGAEGIFNTLLMLAMEIWKSMSTICTNSRLGPSISTRLSVRLSIVVLAIGIILLVIGCIKNVKQRHSLQLIQ